MSSVTDLAESLQQLASNTRDQEASLVQAKQSLEDNASHMNQELESSRTGTEVAQHFQTAVSAIEDAIGKLSEAAQAAEDYANTLFNS